MQGELFILVDVALSSMIDTKRGYTIHDSTRLDSESLLFRRDGLICPLSHDPVPGIWDPDPILRPLCIWVFFSIFFCTILYVQ